MNTLNNKQINPGNRVDFSRIRRFTKGVVPKYQDAPGKLPYNWDWDGLNNAINGGGFGTATTTSLGYNKTFIPQGDIKTVADLEQSQDYTDFTNYVKQNAATDPKVMEYLKNLDAKSRKAGAGTGHLFDVNGNLVQGWESVYDKLRTDGKYGAYHFSASKIQPQSTVTETPDEAEDVQEDVSSNNNFQAVDYTKLPQYKPGFNDTSALGRQYLNTVNTINDQRNALGNTKYALQSPTINHTYSTSGFLQQQQLKQGLAESRNQFEQKNQTGDIATATANRLKFEQQVANPTYQQMANIQDQHIQSSNGAVQQNKNQMFNSMATAAYNNDYTRAAAENADNQQRAKFIGLLGDAKNDYIQQLDLQNKTYTANENQNRAYYNQQVNDYMYGLERDKLLNEQNNILYNTTGTTESGATLTYDDLYAGLQHEIETFGGDDMEADLETWRTSKNDPEKMLELLRKYGAENAEIGAFVSNYDQNYAQHEADFTRRFQELAQKKAYADLVSSKGKLYYSNTFDPTLGTNWTNIDWSKMPKSFKSGGRLTKEDRLLKYFEHRRKQEKDLADRVSKNEDRNQRLLIKQLDALDRETLLLLRAIFK